MKLKLLAACAAASLATGAFAESHSVATTGDAEAGERAFNRCKSCHMIVADDGEAIVRGGRTGPNLYGVVGRQAGTYEDFRYGDSIVAAGEAGLNWTDEAQFVSYLADTNAFLKEYLGDNGARSKMSFRLRDGGEDIYAYLISVGPDAAMGAATN